nr:DUF2800 domain-containing protein [Synergistaceae bacterium]
MAGHSDFGPSGSHRWINCTASTPLCRDMPDQSSGFAEEGTQAHSLCEYFLKREMGIEAEDPRPDLSYYNAEMEECCQGYRDYVMELLEEAKQTTKDPVMLIEQRIQYERFVPGGFGTADSIIIADQTLNVVDFKYGAGVEVDAVGNSQMRIYAIGALEIFDDLYDIDRVRMTIYQPRKSNISVDEISRDELYEWAENVLRPAAEEGASGHGTFHAGEWCRFCKARHVCRERAKENLLLASYDFADPPLLGDEEIVEILEKVDKLVTWANDVKEYALQEAVAGKEWSGWKLVAGRSIRKYVNEKEVADAAEAAGFN